MPQERNRTSDPPRLRVLLAEDRPERAAPIEVALARLDRPPMTRRASSAPDLVRELASGPDVVVVADPGSPLTVERVLALASSPDPCAADGVPVVVLANRPSVARAVACMRLGAADHLHVSHLTRLGDAIERATRGPGSRAVLERRLRESELLRLDLLDSLPWAVIELLTDGTILSANRSSGSLLGETGSLGGRSLLELVAEADRDAIASALRGTGHGAVTPIVARPVTALDRALAFLFAEFATETEPRRLRCFAWDVTAERRTELAAADYARRLRKGERIEALGLLAGGIAHDFNNVLTDIYCVTDLAQLQAGPALAAKFQQIFRAVGRGASLTRQILAFSRGQAGEPRVVELESVVTGMMSMLARIVRQDVRLVFLPSAVRAMVNADPTQLEQVVLNLVLNARDASPPGAEVRVETCVVEVPAGQERGTGAVAVAGADAGPGSGPGPGPGPGSYVVLRVSDEGAGMSECTRRSLFEPFYSTKSEGRGTGLGLFTVSEVVKGHGGTIVVASGPGSGTTFEVYLPRVPGQGVAEGSPEPSGRGPEDGTTDAGLQGHERRATYVPAGWITARARTLGV